MIEWIFIGYSCKNFGFSLEYWKFCIPSNKVITCSFFYYLYCYLTFLFCFVNRGLIYINFLHVLSFAVVVEEFTVKHFLKFSCLNLCFCKERFRDTLKVEFLWNKILWKNEPVWDLVFALHVQCQKKLKKASWQLCLTVKCLRTHIL